MATLPEFCRLRDDFSSYNVKTMSWIDLKKVVSKTWTYIDEDATEDHSIREEDQALLLEKLYYLHVDWYKTNIDKKSTHKKELLSKKIKNILEMIRLHLQIRFNDKVTQFSPTNFISSQSQEPETIIEKNNKNIKELYAIGSESFEDFFELGEQYKTAIENTSVLSNEKVADLYSIWSFHGASDQNTNKVEKIKSSSTICNSIIFENLNRWIDMNFSFNTYAMEIWSNSADGIKKSATLFLENLESFSKSFLNQYQ